MIECLPGFDAQHEKCSLKWALPEYHASAGAQILDKCDWLRQGGLEQTKQSVGYDAPCGEQQQGFFLIH